MAQLNKLSCLHAQLEAMLILSLHATGSPGLLVPPSPPLVSGHGLFHQATCFSKHMPKLVYLCECGSGQQDAGPCSHWLLSSILACLGMPGPVKRFA